MSRVSALLDHLRPFAVASFWNTAYVHRPGVPLLAVWATSLANFLRLVNCTGATWYAVFNLKLILNHLLLTL